MPDPRRVHGPYLKTEFFQLSCCDSEVRTGKRVRLTGGKEVRRMSRRAPQSRFRRKVFRA